MGSPYVNSYSRTISENDIIFIIIYKAKTIVTIEKVSVIEYGQHV